VREGMGISRSMFERETSVYLIALDTPAFSDVLVKGTYFFDAQLNSKVPALRCGMSLENVVWDCFFYPAIMVG